MIFNCLCKALLKLAGLCQSVPAKALAHQPQHWDWYQCRRNVTSCLWPSSHSSRAHVSFLHHDKWYSWLP